MKKPSSVVSDSVIQAREDLGRAMRTGDSAAIDRAYKHLDLTDRMSRARRASAHSIRIAADILERTK